MTAPTTSITESDQALKAKHRVMWALGDYPALARDLTWDLGPGPHPRMRSPSRTAAVRCARGSGSAIPAAQAGASVVACDLTPNRMIGRTRRALR